MSKSTVTARGQVTLPKAVLKRLGLGIGDSVSFSFDPHGRLILRPERAEALGGLVGMLAHLRRERPVTVEEMNEAVRARMRERFGEDRA